MHFLQAINSDISVLIVCNKTCGTIKGDIKKLYKKITNSYLSRRQNRQTVTISISFANSPKNIEVKDGVEY